MSKTKLLTFLVIALILLNLGVISFMLLKKPPRPRPGNPNQITRIIEERLNLDAAQLVQFNQLKEEHMLATKARFEAVGAHKDQLFSLHKTDNLQQKDSLILKISRLHAEIEQLNFKHFQDLKAICKPEQLEDYNNLVTQLGHTLSPTDPRERK